MHNAIKSRLATDTASWAPCQGLIDYLASPLEDVNDIVAWWGKHHFYFILVAFECTALTCFILQQHSMQYPMIAQIAKDYLAIQGFAVPSEHAFSSSVLMATVCCNCLLSNTFGQLQLLKSAYREGHISAASKAELVVPHAHSPIIFE